MEFFTDRNLGRYDFPGLLRAGGVRVHAHEDHFAQNAPDDLWMPEVASRGWIILSPDKRITRDPVELAAIMLSNAAMVCLVGGHEKTLDLAANFLNTFAKIAQFVESARPPYVARLYRPSPVSGISRGVAGSIKLSIDYDAWLASRKSIGFRPS